ncbi:hypothetical protein C922_01320 [Plasmodium inui San Antonio 1]|uniref:Uncharacterized protein n=1 Tax=Plasmodium inui San Antonio 1 TaxID=1237626 RepID=W7A9E0_9APIC|nr:hypothetical protein C922_01320 [Plasmodium inui San Antonio 1]EUD68300.1 hypothetical protein C922_01320 [Plasmodium inui San Antonio 1]
MKIVAIHKGEIAPVTNANGGYHENPSGGYNTDDISGHISGCEKPEAVSSPLGRNFFHTRYANGPLSNGTHRGRMDNSCVFSNTGEDTPVGSDEYVHRSRNTKEWVHTGESDVEKETSPTRGNNPRWGEGRKGAPSTKHPRSEDVENAEEAPDCHSHCSVNKNILTKGGNSRLVKPLNGDPPNRGVKYSPNGESGADQNIYRPRSWKGEDPKCDVPSPVEELPPRRGRGNEEGETKGKGKIPPAYESKSTVDGIDCLPLPDSTTNSSPGNGTSGNSRTRAISHPCENAEEGENRLEKKKNVHNYSSTSTETKRRIIQQRNENGKRLMRGGSRSVGEWKNPLEGNHRGHLIQGDAITAANVPHGRGRSNVKREQLHAESQKGAVVMGSARCQPGGAPVWKENEHVEKGRRSKRGRLVRRTNCISMGGQKNGSLEHAHARDKNEEEAPPMRSLLVFDEISNTWNILWKYGGVSIIKSYSIDVGGSASRHVALNDLQSINNLYGEVTTGVGYLTREKWDLMKRKIYKKFGEKYFFISKDNDGVDGRMSGMRAEDPQRDKSDIAVESIGEVVSKMGKKLREAHNNRNRVKYEEICSMAHDRGGGNVKSMNIERGSVIPFGQSSEGPFLKSEEERKFRKGEHMAKRDGNDGGRSGHGKEGTADTGDTKDTPTKHSKGKEGLTSRKPPAKVPKTNEEERKEQLRRKRHENKLKEELERRERKRRREEEKEKKIRMKEDKKRMREEKKKKKEEERIRRKEERVHLRKVKKLEKWENMERLRRWKRMKKLEKMGELGRVGRRERQEKQEKLSMAHRIDRVDRIDSAKKLKSANPIIGEGRSTKGNSLTRKLNSTPGKDEDNCPNRCSQLGEAHYTPDSAATVVRTSLQDELKKRLFLEKKQKVLKVMRKNVPVQERVYLDVGYGDEASGEGGHECHEFGEDTSRCKAGSWVVSWVLYGRTCRKRFPIEEYGFEKARQMAEEYKRERLNSILNSVSEYDTYVREALSCGPEEGGASCAWSAGTSGESVECEAGRGEPGAPLHAVDRIERMRAPRVQDACTLVASEEQRHHRQLIQFCCELLKKPVSEEQWKNKVKWVQHKKSWNIEIVKKEQNRFIREKIYYSEEKYGYIIGKCIAVYDYLNAEHNLLKSYFDVNVANLQYDNKRHAWKISRYVPNQLNKKNYYFDVSVYGWMCSRKLGLLLAIYLNRRRPLRGDEEMLRRGSSLVRHLQEDSIDRRRCHPRDSSNAGEDHSENVAPKFLDDVKGADLRSSDGQLNRFEEKRVGYFHSNGVTDTSKQSVGGSYADTGRTATGEEEKRGNSNALWGFPDRVSGDAHPVKTNRDGHDRRDGRDESAKRGRKRRKKTNGEEERTPNCETDDEDATKKRRHSQNEEKKIKNKTTAENGMDLKKLYETIHNRKYCQLKEMHTCNEKELLNFLSNEKDRALFLMEDIHIQREDEYYLVNILENYYYYHLCRKLLKVRKRLSM